MRSAREQLVQLGQRGLATSASLLAVPAVAPTGLFSFLNRSKRVSTPLDTPLDGVQLVTPVAVPKAAPTTQMTTLPNGVRVAAEESMVRAARPCCPPGVRSPPPPQGPYASLGIFVSSGSIYETPYTAGAPMIVLARVARPRPVSAERGCRPAAS